MLKITYYNRDKRAGNFSIEELFTTIRSGMKGKVIMNDYTFDPAMGRIKAIKDAAKYQGDLNHITGDVNFLAYGLKPSKTILTVHDVGHYENTLKGWKKIVYKYLWLQWPLNRVGLITTISEFTKNRLIKYFNIPAHKIKVIYNPCPADFTYSAKEFNESKPKILQIGPGRNKNIYRLIDAVENISCEIILIRTPDKALKKVLDDKKISYQWLSNLSYKEVIEEYKKCDLLFFASEYEGFGMPIIEANATGRPVLTGNISAMPEVAGDAACIVNPFSVEDIREGLLKIINDQIYREKLIANGFENIKRFNQRNVTEQYLKLYTEVVKR